MERHSITQTCSCPEIISKRENNTHTHRTLISFAEANFELLQSTDLVFLFSFFFSPSFSFFLFLALSCVCSVCLRGHASYLFEKLKNPSGVLPGSGSFVSAFGQSNLGDVTPNTRGPSCPDGSSCDFNTSTCGGRSQGCTAKGPGVDQYDSMRIIGNRQFEAALNLYESASEELTNEGIDYRYQYFDMQSINVSKQWSSTGKEETTCRAAMGYSFAAGTIDGPGSA